MSQIRYFAVFREQAGKEQESLESLDLVGKSLETVYQILKQKYQFTLLPQQVKFVVNEVYTNSDYRVRLEDEVVLIPPVAGG